MTSAPAEHALTTFFITRVLPALWLAILFAGPLCLAESLRSLRHSVGPRGRRSRHGSRSSTATPWLVLGITAIGGALRWWLPTHGPGDLRNTMEGAYAPGGHGIASFGPYGSAPDTLLRLLFDLREVFPTSDDVAIWVSFLAAVGTIPLASGLLHRLRLSERLRAEPALLVALMPMHIHYSPTINRFTLAIFLALLGWFLLLRFLDERRPHDLIVSFAALVLAPQCRAELVYLLPLTVALPWVWARSRAAPVHSPSGTSDRRQPRGHSAGEHAPRLLPRYWPLLAVLYVFLVGYPLYWTVWLQLWSPGVVASNVGTLRPWHLVLPSHNLLLNPRYTPALWAPLTLAGAWWAVRQRPIPGGWLMAAAVASLLVIASHDAHDNLNSARYHLVTLTVNALLAAVALCRLLDGLPKPRWRHALVGAVVLSAIPPPAVAPAAAHHTG